MVIVPLLSKRKRFSTLLSSFLTTGKAASGANGKISLFRAEKGHPTQFSIDLSLTDLSLTDLSLSLLEP